MIEQVIVLALEARMGLLLNFKYHITGHNAGHLVALTSEVDPMTSLHAAVDVNVENLTLDNGLFAVTLFTAVLFADDFALALAIRAYGLESLNHRSHLSHHRLHAVTVTAMTL